MANNTFEKPTSDPIVIFDQKAKDKMLDPIFANPKKEIGGLLIGTISQDPVTKTIIVFVNDVYMAKEYGSSSGFVFDSKFSMDAYEYIKKIYKDRDYGITNRVIGNVHSHAQYDAFWSATDKQMMEKIKTDELYMVISPSENNYKAVLKLISNQPGKNHDYYPVNHIQSIDLNKGQQSKYNKYTSNWEN